MHDCLGRFPQPRRNECGNHRSTHSLLLGEASDLYALVVPLVQVPVNVDAEDRSVHDISEMLKSSTRQGTGNVLIVSRRVVISGNRDSCDGTSSIQHLMSVDHDVSSS